MAQADTTTVFADVRSRR